MKVELQDLEVEGLRVIMSDDGMTLKLAWSGEISMRAPKLVLEPYLNHAIDMADQNRSLHIDFSAMQFMNSASLVPILSCLRSLSNKNIPTRVSYSKASSWQRVSYNSMTVLAKGLQGISIEYVKTV